MISLLSFPLVFKVNIMPAHAFIDDEPGFFRMCFTAQSQEVLMEALKRVVDYFNAL